jgi:hypothetical protein
MSWAQLVPSTVRIKMKKEVGNKNSEIWLLGDSNPKNWQAVLETPFDPRHPERHSIWTPVLETIQAEVFRECRNRLDTSSIYIRNAVEDPTEKPLPVRVKWDTDARERVREFQELVLEHHPVVLFSFGAFAFEFARRVFGEEPARSYNYWRTKRLGQQFRKRVSKFDVNAINLLPLLDVSIAGRWFLKNHEYFCARQNANYFEYAGKHIARRLIEHRDKLNIWL